MVGPKLIVTSPQLLASVIFVSVANVSASEDSAQLVSGQVPFVPGFGAVPGSFDCSSIAQNGSLASGGPGTASCIKLVDGPFVLTDLLSLPPPDSAGPTWLFAAPPSASWDSSTQAQWFVEQTVPSGQTPISSTGMRYVVPTGSSLYAVSAYRGLGLSFSWAGFKPYR
jgi:hypothetical protein